MRVKKASYRNARYDMLRRHNCCTICKDQDERTRNGGALCALPLGETAKSRGEKGTDKAMLVKIGDCWVDPEEIAMINDSYDFPLEAQPQICIYLRHGSGTWIHSTMDEAEAALIDAGYIENPYPEEDEPPELTAEEHAAAADLYDRDFEWLARDKDGKLYAFRDKPAKDGAYWNSFANKAEPVDEDFGFISFEDEEPWSIAYLLLE